MESKAVMLWFAVGVVVHLFLWGDSNVAGGITYFIIVDAVVSFLVIVAIGLIWVGFQWLGEKLRK